MTKELYVAPNDKKNEDIKEDFCPVCAIAPLVVAGAASGTAAGTSKNGSKMKTIILWSSIAVVIIGIIALIYFRYGKKCESCK